MENDNTKDVHMKNDNRKNDNYNTKNDNYNNLRDIANGCYFP